ncbi:MAG: adenylosuccinate lyase [Spirochaetes bacterium]|nr:adenylosuccinate lyase [Spirochaetota bacterium]
MVDYSGYLSPFSWRYGGAQMRALWSEIHKRELWRQLWVSLARVESGFGLVSDAQVAELEARAPFVDMERSLAIEAEIRHDLMAEIRAFAELCPLAGGVIHLGATSMDIEDNADTLRIRESLDLVMAGLRELLVIFADRIEALVDLPVMAFTHLQPAEPTSLGYRCSVWAQDILISFEQIEEARASLRGKGFKGAVGTSASYAELLGLKNLPAFEAAMSKELGLEFFPVTTQTASRLQEYRVLSALSALGAALHKMAFDFRILQSPPIGEFSEPFGRKQVGSSAMPFKRNPIEAEKIDSLARLLSSYSQTAWSNAALSLLERTLDDSANRRTILPEAFLASDELIGTAKKIVEGFVVDESAVKRTFARYAPFACTERVLMAMAKAGADRQETHERLRLHALASWEAIRRGEENPLVARMASDEFFSDRLGAGQIPALMDARAYLGDSAARAKRFALVLRSKAAALD